MKNNNNFLDGTIEEDVFSCDVKPQKAFLVIILNSDDTEESSRNRVEELTSLALTMGVTVVDSTLIKIRKENSATLIGSGKVQELKEIVDNTEIDLFIFDNDLSPRIQRNLQI